MALAALVLQLALSVGHIHADEVFPGATGGSEGFVVNAAAWLLDLPRPVPKDDTGDSDHDNCAICASMAMLGTGSVPLPPVIVVPVAIVIAIVLPPAATTLASLPRLPFSARAPPLS